MTTVQLIGERAPETTEVSMAIGGMTCGACAARIERRLNRIDGVEATVSYAAERARVAMAPGVPVARVVEAVESAGYTATVAGQRATLEAQEAEADRRVRELGRRLVVAGLLFMPLCDLSIAFSLVPSVRFPGWQWLLMVLAAPVVTWAAWPFHRAAARNALHGTSTMDTLVSLGVISATAWSLYAMFFQDTGHAQQSVLWVLSHESGGSIYLDVAAGVTTFLLAGRYFEASSKRRTGSALRSLAAVGAKDVAVLDDTGSERRRPVAALRVGERFVVRPGETVATDGEVLQGHAAVDRSAMTGESVPEDVGPGDRVVGGTVAAGGRLVVRATEVGLDTQLAHMVRLVEEAQHQKAAVQRLADRISAVFVPAVIVAALATLAGWLLAGSGGEQAFNAALSVLIIACPCALGLATPTALLVASGQGARRGIFFKGYQALETSRQVDTVVLDKTGTVTEGRMVLAGVECAPGVARTDLLRWAGAVEQASEHLVARAVAAAARDEVGPLPDADRFRALPGLGARGVVEGHPVAVGRPGALHGTAAPPAPVAERCRAWE
ncbi:MAG: heavy metal translocating P-type ATPase, partial [Acidimicrobiales bacterium]